MRHTLLLAALLAGCSRDAPRTHDSTATAAPDAAPSPPPDTSASPWAVSEAGAGAVRVGMTTAEARLASGGALTLPVTLDASCEYARVRNGPGGLRFMLADGRVARAEVDSASVPTTRGARVGDSEERVRSLYPGIRTEPHKYTNGHYLVAATATDTTRLVVFETDGRVVTRYYAGRMPEVRWVENCG